MPPSLDDHEHIPNLTADAVAQAHARDVAVQGLADRLIEAREGCQPS